MDLFEGDAGSEIGGVGGRITNLPTSRPSRLARFFMMDGPEGHILPSGRNVLVFTGDGPRRVQWLSGCSMSYRREIIRRHRFDERMSLIGEDVDISTRVGQDAELWIHADARMAHWESPIGRQSMNGRIRTELVSRHYRVRSGIGGQSIIAFWWSCLGMILLYSRRIVIRDPRQPVRSLAAIFQGIGEILLTRRAR